MMQKVKYLLCKKDISEEESSHLQFVVLTLVQHARENVSASAPWDLDLCTLDANNYGTAVWRLLLKVIPLVLELLNYKQLISICSSIQYVILNSQETGVSSLNHIMMSHVRSELFSESKAFQSAFVMALWKSDLVLSKKRVIDEISEYPTFNDVMRLNSYRSKYIKYAHTTPQIKNKECNALWVAIMETCEIFNKVMLEDGLCDQQLYKINEQSFRKIKLIECLPLEYLLPGNQMQCLIGISVLFFLTPNLNQKHGVPELAEQLATQMVKILEGVRSIWLFDFVSSGPFLQNVFNTINKLLETENSRVVKPWMKILLDCVISKICKRNNSFVGLEFYLSKNMKATGNDTDAVFLLSLYLILKKLHQLFQRAYISPDFKETRQNIFNMSGYCFKKYLKTYKDSSEDFIPEYLMSCYMTMLEIICMPDCDVEARVRKVCLEGLASRALFSIERLSDDQARKEIYLQFIEKLCSLKKTEVTNYLPKNFRTISWDAIVLYLKNKCQSSTKEISSDSISIQEYEVGALRSVCSIMENEFLNNTFEEITSDICELQVESLDARSLQMNLLLLKYLIDSCSSKEEIPFSTQSFTNLLTHLHCIMNELCQSSYALHKIKIPVFEFLHFLVKKQAPCIPKQCLISSLHSCLSVKLEPMTSNVVDFTKAFIAIWNIVYDLLIHHPGIVLSSRAAYLSLVSILLKAIIKGGAQEVVSVCDKNVECQLQLCAQNMERLLTVLSRHKTKLSKLVPFLIADYIDSKQDITLDFRIKVHLTSGLNRLIDLCTEESLKMLSVHLKNNCQAMFLNIVKHNKKRKYDGSV